MYIDSCTTDYLQRGSSNFDEQAHNYYRIRAGRKSSFDPLSLPAALYWSNAGQRSSDGDFSFDQVQGRHLSGTSVRLRSGAFQHPSRQSTTPPAPFNPPSQLQSGADVQFLQTSPVSSTPQPEVLASASAPPWQQTSPEIARSAPTSQQTCATSTAPLQQVIRSQPRRPGQVSADLLISTSQQRRSNPNMHRAQEIDTEHATYIETENSHELEIQNAQEVDRESAEPGPHNRRRNLQDQGDLMPSQQRLKKKKSGIVE